MPTLPAQPPQGEMVASGICDGLAAQCRTLPSPARGTLRRWLVDAKQAQRPFSPPKTGPWSTQTYAAVNAAHACLTHLWDDEQPDALTRAALALVLGDDIVQPALRTGGLIGSLTPDEAKRLAQIAVAFGRSDADVCAQLGALVAA